MHCLLHFADSEVGRLWRDGDDLVLAFAAAQVSLTAPDGSDTADTGYVRGLVLRLQRADAASRAALPGDAIGRLAWGRLTLAGRACPTLAVPQQLHGPLRLVLDFANGTPWSADAQGLLASFSGDPDFRTALAC